MKQVCIIGCGSIGSLYAAHLARVADVWAFVRRADHAGALNRDGLRVSGKHNFSVALKATANPRELPEFDLGIVATKATQVEEAITEAGSHFDQGAVISAQNGIGSEEIIAEYTRGEILRGTTFMSGTRHSDTHVQYELDTATWLGPFEPRRTPYATAKEAADLIVASGLKAEALPDARPAQRSEEHTSELQSRLHLVCRLLLEKKKHPPGPAHAHVPVVHPAHLPCGATHVARCR